MNPARQDVMQMNKIGSLGFAVIRPHIWRQRVGQIGNLSYIWADITAIPNEP